MKGEHSIEEASYVVGISNVGNHKYCFKLIAKGSGGSELVMDAGGSSQRMKWIMAIDSFILMVKAQAVKAPESLSPQFDGKSTRKISRGSSLYFEPSNLAENFRSETQKKMIDSIENMIHSWLENSKEAYAACVTRGIESY